MLCAHVALLVAIYIPVTSCGGLQAALLPLHVAASALHPLCLSECLGHAAIGHHQGADLQAPMALGACPQPI